MAVLADLDVIVDLDKLDKVLEVLAPAGARNGLLSEARAIAEAVRKEPPDLPEKEVRRRLEELQSGHWQWDEGDDAMIGRKLKEIANALDRKRKLKRNGLEGLPESVRERGEALVKNLEGIGLFLVPVGELEMWLADRRIETSPRNKWAWANEAAATIRVAGTQSGDVWDYCRRAVSYLRQTGRRTK